MYEKKVSDLQKKHKKHYSCFQLPDNVSIFQTECGCVCVCAKKTYKYGSGMMFKVSKVN